MAALQFPLQELERRQNPSTSHYSSFDSLLLSHLLHALSLSWSYSLQASFQSCRLQEWLAQISRVEERITLIMVMVLPATGLCERSDSSKASTSIAHL